jgi:hypothetical protein
MAKIFKEIVKIPLTQDRNFNQREREINQEVQRQIDFFNARGYITESHEISHRSDVFASVTFNLRKMVGA